MSNTIYAGKTKNGVIIDDMVDDNRDLVYRDTRYPGYFIRLCQSLLDENDEEFETAGPALAVFNEAKPLEPIWGVRLTGQFSDYTNEWEAKTDLMEKEMEKLWENFGQEYIENSVISAINIEWHIEFEDVYNELVKLPAAEAVKVLGDIFTKDTYENMTEEERREAVFSLFVSNPSRFYGLFGLPEEYVLTEEEMNEVNHIEEVFSYIDIGYWIMRKFNRSLKSITIQRELKSNLQWKETKKAPTKFGVALKEKPLDYGLTKSEVMNLFDMIDGKEAFPVEFDGESSTAMGFISIEDADLMDYDYTKLQETVYNILSDMNNENESCIYECPNNQGTTTIWLSR